MPDSPLTGPKRDEALVSAGWGLRRTATRPKPVAAPGRLTLKNTAFAGEVEARWGRVGNAHYHEYQLAVTLSSPEPVLFDTLPILANGPTSCFFSGHPRRLLPYPPRPWQRLERPQPLDRNHHHPHQLTARSRAVPGATPSPA